MAYTNWFSTPTEHHKILFVREYCENRERRYLKFVSTTMYFSKISFALVLISNLGYSYIILRVLLLQIHFLPYLKWISTIILLMIFQNVFVMDLFLKEKTPLA
uniref:Uncharacterized protein n=1 Tax=Cacopsylla melanoneura TaxID=428564 RepID=A0A8D8YU07_9HEMI